MAEEESSGRRCGCRFADCNRAFSTRFHEFFESHGILEETVYAWWRLLIVFLTICFLASLVAAMVETVLEKAPVYFSIPVVLFVLTFTLLGVRWFILDRAECLPPRETDEAADPAISLAEMSRETPPTSSVSPPTSSLSPPTSSLSSPLGTRVGEAVQFEADFHERQSQSSAPLSTDVATSLPSDSADSVSFNVGPGTSKEAPGKECKKVGLKKSEAARESDTESSTCSSSDVLLRPRNLSFDPRSAECSTSRAAVQATSGSSNSATNSSPRSEMPDSAEPSPLSPERSVHTESGDADGSSSASVEYRRKQTSQRPKDDDEKSGSTHL